MLFSMNALQTSASACMADGTARYGPRVGRDFDCAYKKIGHKYLSSIGGLEHVFHILGLKPPTSSSFRKLEHVVLPVAAMATFEGYSNVFIVVVTPGPRQRIQWSCPWDHTFDRVMMAMSSRLFVERWIPLR